MAKIIIKDLNTPSWQIRQDELDTIVGGFKRRYPPGFLESLSSSDLRELGILPNPSGSNSNQKWISSLKQTNPDIKIWYIQAP